MISQQRLDELKRCDNPHKFFDEFSCEVNSIVKPYRKVFEDKAHIYNEKHLKFLVVVEKWLEKRKKHLPPSVFEQYQKQLSGANNSVSPVRLEILEQCQKQLSNILEQGVDKNNNHLILSRETRILRQRQKQLNIIVRAAMDTGKTFVSPPDLGIIEQCLMDIRWQYQEAGWKEIKIWPKIQTRRGRTRNGFTLTLFVPPDFPDDPLWWFDAYDLTWYNLKARVTRNKFTCSPEDELLRGYIAIALLFNEQAEKRGETLIAPSILSDIFTLRLTVKFLQEYWTETQNKSRQRPTDYWPEIRSVLISDLEAVDRDLASKQKKDEQTASGGKAGDKTQNTRSTITAIIISCLMILLFELLIYEIPFVWLINHPNSYSLQVSIIFLIPSVVIGLFKSRWRKWCWGTAGFGLFLLIISLLGGKSR